MPNVGNIKGTLSNQEAYTETESPLRTGQYLQSCIPTHLEELLQLQSAQEHTQLQSAEGFGSLMLPPSTDINTHSVNQKSLWKLGVGITHPPGVFHFNNNVDSELSQNRLVQNY